MRYAMLAMVLVAAACDPWPGTKNPYPLRTGGVLPGGKGDMATADDLAPGGGLDFSESTIPFDASTDVTADPALGCYAWSDGSIVFVDAAQNGLVRDTNGIRTDAGMWVDVNVDDGFYAFEWNSGEMDKLTRTNGSFSGTNQNGQAVSGSLMSTCPIEPQ